MSGINQGMPLQQFHIPVANLAVAQSITFLHPLCLRVMYRHRRVQRDSPLLMVPGEVVKFFLAVQVVAEFIARPIFHAFSLPILCPETLELVSFGVQGTDASPCIAIAGTLEPETRIGVDIVVVPQVVIAEVILVRPCLRGTVAAGDSQCIACLVSAILVRVLYDVGWKGENCYRK